MSEPPTDSTIIPIDEPGSPAPAHAEDTADDLRAERQRLVQLIEEAQVRIAGWQADLVLVDERIAALPAES